MTVNIARLVIAGLSGDSGKTIVSLSLLAVLRQKHFSLSVFKKGPDYIDAAWLTNVAGKECRNLDSYMVKPKRLYRSFVNHAAQSDIAVIEGNRGLFDGKDADGTHSTAELSKLLQAPVVLVVSCRKSTRTIAALVKGCKDFDPELNLVGIVLNRVNGKRHEAVVCEAIDKYTQLPVLGVLPRLESETFLIPGRHLGLIPPAEFEQKSDFHSGLIETGSKYLDVDKLIEIAGNAPVLDFQPEEQQKAATEKVKIGYFCDSVFTFYYPENLEALEQAGSKLVPVSSLTDKALPEIDALYIGGGFPETFAQRLTKNESMLQSVKSAAERGMPIYAECGGLIYLSRSLRWKEAIYPMAGVFSLDIQLTSRPVGHGYTQLKVDCPNPFFKIGDIIRGHEFHYSVPIDRHEKPGSNLGISCFAVETGVGLGYGRDGLLYKSTLASYTHIHAEGVNSWADSLVDAALQYQFERQKNSKAGQTKNVIN